MKRLLNQKIAKRILFSFFLFSFLITAISIGVILYSQYTNEKNEVLKDSQTLIDSKVGFISEVLWNMDKPLAELSIKSLVEDPKITHIVIYDENKKMFSNAGDKNTIFSNTIEIPLQHLNQDKKTSQEIGTIVANITTISAEQHVKDNLINIVLVQTLKSVITSFIFLFLIYNIMIKHLNKITDGIVINSNNAFNNNNELIKLNRTQRNDELQLLADTLNKNKLARNKHLKKLDIENNKLIKEIASRKVAEDRATSAHEELLFVLDSLPTSVYVCKNKGEVIFMNHKAKKLLSESDSVASATNHKQYLNQIVRFYESEDIHSTPIDIAELVKSYQFTSSFNAYHVSNDGQDLFTLVELTVIPTKQNGSSQDPNFIIVVKDKSGEARLEEMNYMVSHDYLTKVHNRLYLGEQIDKILATGSTGYSLAIIDLDKIKEVNDACGHVAGDQLLKLVAETIPKSLGSYDLLARIGGAEFAVLFNLNEEESVQKSFNIISDIEALNFTYKNTSLPISCVIGISSLKVDDINTEAVMVRAYKACSKAENKGKGSVLTYRNKVDGLKVVELS